MHAIRDAHLADSHSMNVEAGDASLPSLDETLGVLLTKPIALTSDAGGNPDPDGPYFRLRYELVASEPLVRVTSTGFDGDLTRIMQMDFLIEKKIEYAVVSPNRIMIGKNVRVEGPLGTRYGLVGNELVPENGDPLIMRSDFYYLDAALDAKLDTFFDQMVAFDVDGDARLRPDHPTEGSGLTGFPDLVDYDGDEYVDDFDLFLAHYDTNTDLMVVYDATLAAAAGHGSLTDEFSAIDDQLARLIDESTPDRNDDGVVDAIDTAYGYLDGILDVNDLYAKVRGHVAFAITRAAWETAHGESYQTVVNGPLRPGTDIPPVEFEVADAYLLEITTDMFSDSHTWFETEADTGADFATQTGAGGTFTPAASNDWESVPFGAPGAYDYYQRDKYADYTFNNLKIPVGSNALFENCVFKGVTYVETEVGCEDENWNYSGARTRVETALGVYEYPLAFEGLTADHAGSPVADTKPLSNNIRFHNCTFLGSISSDVPNEYTHWRNKLQFTGNTRFYIDPADEDLATQPDAVTLTAELNSIPAADRAELAKSSILTPGYSVDVGNFNNEQAADPADTPSVNLKGTMVSGVFDVRGTADVHGTLVMTFRPGEGAGPLFYGGMPDVFNTTIGYFGPADGDGEGVDPSDASFDGFGEITLRYNPDALIPDGVPWPVRVVPEPTTYVEGGF
jgi:hypothetical protein